MEGKISVIIPAYNTEKYLDKCLNSILEQTYNNFEIIIVNDGSQDNTLQIARSYESDFDFIKVIDITNHGQGYARNLALKEATGEYILFMDSDDWLERVTFQVAIDRIKEDKSDFVFFDWKYYFDKTERYKYTNTEEFFDKKILENESVLDLFTIKHYFTVNKLYSKKFLLENNIRYGEGYIYEDIVFWAQVVIFAKKVSVVHSPLYNVRVNTTSTTKTKFETERHYIGFLKAMEETIKLTNKKPENNYNDLYNYFINKFNVYYKKRTPNKYKRKFVYSFVEEMSKAVDVKDFEQKSTLLRMGFKYNIFKKKKKFIFYLMYKIYNLINLLKVKLKQIKKKFSRLVKKVSKNKKDKFNIQERNLARDKVKEKSILFMGFDYRYTGNSRYLFEMLVTKKVKNIFFVTEDKMVNEKYRIKPESKEMYHKLYNSKVVIFESWTPKQFTKMEDSVWIQLWHGTPLKKMLYDSEEAEIISKNKYHKIYKYKDINKWDYLLLDNKNIYKYFETSFLIPEEKTLAAGYPRVKYLIDNIKNKKLKDKIRKELKIGINKKVVTYLPTWRDYNYGKKESELDLEYFVDMSKLQEELGDEYIVVSKNHAFLNNEEANKITNVTIETQELLLITDYLVTDYSSVMFDALPINLPVVVFANDLDKYEKSRGLYKSIWNDLLPFVADKETELAKIIKSYNINSEEYKNLKEKYGYNSEIDLIQFILNIKGGK